MYMSDSVSYPLSEWVRTTIYRKIMDRVVLEANAKKLWKYARMVSFRNSCFLRDLFEYEYQIVYSLRSHPELSDFIVKATLVADIANGAKKNHYEYWSDKNFSGFIIHSLLHGLVTFPGIEFTGPLTEKLIAPLLSLAPPLLNEISTELHNQYSILTTRLIDDIEKPVAEEIYISLERSLNELINKCKEQYWILYNLRGHETENKLKDSIVPGYDLWFTSRGTPEMMKFLCVNAENEIKDLTRKASESITSGESLITISEIIKVKDVYNDILECITFYNNEIEFTNVVDNFLVHQFSVLGDLKLFGMPELLPEQLKLNGTMIVKAENKFLKSFTMREIGMGLPMRESSIFNSLSYDYDGIYKKLHSNTFEKQIRMIPDALERFLMTKISEILSEKQKRKKLKKYYDFSINMAIKDFLKKNTGTSIADFKQAITSFICKETSPFLLSIYTRELSDLIVIRGNGELNECRLLAISILKGECKILSQNLLQLYNDKETQIWLADHLCAAHRCDEGVKHAYDRYRYGYHGNLGIPVLNDCPFRLSSSDDFLGALCDRYAAKATSDADSYIKTSGEKAVDYILEFVGLTTLTLSLRPAITALGQFIQLVLGTTVISITKITKFCNSDSEDVKDNVFWEVLTDFVSQLVLNGIGVVKIFKYNLSKQISQQLTFHGKEILNKLQRSTFEKIVLQADYKKPSQLIVKGVTADTYKLGRNEIIKDYKSTASEFVTRPEWLKNFRSRSIEESIQDRSFSYAYHNAVAMNRIYGPGTAKVFVHKKSGELTSSVSLKMKKIPGETLNTLINSGDREFYKKAIQLLDDVSIDEVSTDLVKNLTLKGILHNDINMGNILYDTSSGTFNLIDFDDSVINPVLNGVISPINSTGYQRMYTKLKDDLKMFREACRDNL